MTTYRKSTTCLVKKIVFTTYLHTAFLKIKLTYLSTSYVSKKIKIKTYNSGDSPVVTHLTTNPPVSCLSTAERTGSAGCQDPMVVCDRFRSFIKYIARSLCFG
jgi:hypothetical protein